MSSETIRHDVRGIRGATPDSGNPLFRRDDLLSGRFKIVRLIGQGGMGAVYEVEDLELGGYVALKTVRPDTVADTRILERFKQEIYLARKVTHPNVCRIFDLFHHRIVASDTSIMFVTMELLRGETLAEHLRRTGRIPSNELLPLVTQMAEGLQAAHQAGIVHRDFKPSNVVLVPLKENSEEVRAVVTDFGLAHTSAADATARLALTGTGDIVGTPAYIAPEVLDKRGATPATDIYALGVVMYEMVTGQLPFSGDTPLSTVLERLRKPAESPRTIVPDLDPRSEAIILRCLEREPSDRFARAADVIAAFREQQPTAVPSLRRRRTRQFALAIAAVAVLVLVLGTLATWARRTAGDTVAAPAIATPLKVRRSVAVLGFKNLSQRSEAAWLSGAFSDMLTTELAAGEKLRTVSGEQVVRMKLDLQLADADSFARDTLALIRKNLGTDLVVLGSYVALGEKGHERIRLDLRVQDAVAGETIASVTDSGTQEELLALVSRAGATLRDKLGVGELSGSDAARVKASQPLNPDVIRLYTEGLAKLRVSENLAARDLFEKVITAEPEFPLVHSALAATWSALGYDGRASDAAKRAFELSSNLSREERLAIEGRYRESTRERERAIEIYRTLFDFFPDNIDYGLRLAAVQSAAGKAKDALATVDVLRMLPQGLHDDPRVDLAEGRAAGALSDYKRQLDAADRAAQKALARGTPVLLAQARLLQNDALGGLGQLDKRVAPLEEARKLYAGAGDRAGVADAISRMAVVRRLQGDQTESMKLYAEAFEIFRGMGNQAGMAIATGNQANTLMRLGRLPEARKMFEEALANFRRVGRKDAAAITLNNIAIVLRQQGDFEGSMARYEESLAIAREIGMKAQVANALGNMANLLTPRGDLARARKLYEDALVISREISDKTTMARTIGNLSLVLVKQGDVATARKLCEEAVVLTREIGEKREVAYALKHLGNALHHQGELAHAVTKYQEALEIAQAIQEKSLIAETLSAFGHALLAQGKLADAKSRYQDALAIREAAVKNGVADSKLNLATVAIEDRRFAEGEALLRQTIETYRQFKEPDSIATVYVVLARALLAQGKLGAARDAIKVAVDSSRTTQDQIVRAAVAMTSARINAAANDDAALLRSIENLKKVVADATNMGLTEVQLEARLALAQLQTTGDASSARDGIAAVEKDAAAKGFGLIARQASAAMR